jgi:hypothetical protein
MEYFVKIGHNRFFLHPSHFIIFTHPTIRNYIMCVVEKESLNILKTMLTDDIKLRKKKVDA